jgi:glucose/arabinose dehydrogenase
MFSVKPIDAGKHQIEKDQVGTPLPREGQPVLTTAGWDDGESRLVEVIAQQLEDALLVLDDKNDLPRVAHDSRIEGNC